MIGDIAASYGKPYPWDVRVRLLGTTEMTTAKIAVTELELPITIDEFRAQFTASSRQKLLDVDMMKGVHSTLSLFFVAVYPFVHVSNIIYYSKYILYICAMFRSINH